MKTTIKALGCLVALALLACVALAQEGAWKSDYAKALEVSKASGHPILILFDRVSNKTSLHDTVAALDQDASFRDASKRFTLVQVEAFKVSEITDLDWYKRQAEPPAAAIVGFDGKPAKTYAEIPSVETLASDMLQEFADLTVEQADRLAASGDDHAAVAMYWTALTVKPPEATVERARRALTEASRRGRLKVAEVEDMISAGQYLKAKERLQELSDAYAGTDAAKAATARMNKLTRDPSVVAEIARQQREEDASAILEKARKAAAGKNFDEAKLLYSRVIDDYGDTAAAKTAAEESRGMHKTTAAETDAARKKADDECRLWLSYADNYAQQDRQSEAIKYYKKIIAEHPNTSFADIAGEKLKKLQ